MELGDTTKPKHHTWQPTIKSTLEVGNLVGVDSSIIISFNIYMNLLSGIFLKYFLFPCESDL
jgi:hypothetical protein